MKPRLTILVVDDSEPMRAILAAVLTSVGHDVLQADTVAAAKDAVVGYRPDLILTDYNMPGRTGADLVRWVRDRTAPDPTPIIVVSSEQNLALHARMARAGVERWISKPVCLVSLLGAVEAVATRPARPARGRPALRAAGASDLPGNLSIQ